MIREYQAGDCEELLDVWATASAVGHPFLGEEFLELERRRIPEVYLPNAETWVWETDGRVVGFVALLGNEVGALFVDPRFHRSGIGRALLDHVRALRGELEVEVFRRNTIGRAFYARYGFELLHEGVHEETGFEVLRLGLPAPGDKEPGAARPEERDFTVLLPDDLPWRRSNLMQIPNADLLGTPGGNAHLGGRLWRLPPYSANTWHRHVDSHELYLVLEGTGRLRVGSQTLTLPRYGSALVAPEALRQLFNDTADDALWLVVSAPPESPETLKAGVSAFYPEDPKSLPPELRDRVWPPGKDEP